MVTPPRIFVLDVSVLLVNVSVPAKEANVCEALGKAKIADAGAANVIAPPVVTRLPPSVIVEDPLLTPVPPNAGDKGDEVVYKGLLSDITYHIDDEA